MRRKDRWVFWGLVVWFLVFLVVIGVRLPGKSSAKDFQVEDIFCYFYQGETDYEKEYLFLDQERVEAKIRGDEVEELEAQRKLDALRKTLDDQETDEIMDRLEKVVDFLFDDSGKNLNSSGEEALEYLRQGKDFSEDEISVWKISIHQVCFYLREVL